MTASRISLQTGRSSFAAEKLFSKFISLLCLWRYLAVSFSHSCRKLQHRAFIVPFTFAFRVYYIYSTCTWLTSDLESCIILDLRDFGFCFIASPTWVFLHRRKQRGHLLSTHFLATNALSWNIAHSILWNIYRLNYFPLW